jgi:ABC-type lipoprotein export system ATPase subunit
MRTRAEEVHSMNTETYSRGAEWRQWDLHFHTPSSYDYKDTSVTNEEIIDELVRKNISVVAVTDHGTIDVSRIASLRSLGQNKHITVLPGIEFLSSTVGKVPVHFIGIFDENCKLQYVWDQLRSKTNLSKVEGEGQKLEEIYCDLIPTADLIHELGGVVTIHAGKKSNSLENVTHAVPHSAAHKQDIAKVVDFFELGKIADIEDYTSNVIKFLQAKIKKTHPLILCSDNHNIRSYELKAKLWIKADPTFAGLRQVINEPNDRVFIGEKPESILRIQKNRTKYIKSLSIVSKAGYDGRHGTWFENVEIPINGELVAIIGNKGSGKSALSDIISLCANYQNHEDFSFLNSRKFRDGKHDKNFEATLTWQSDTAQKRGLDDKSTTGPIEDVKYLPQGHFERLTNEISTAREFQSEIEKVVFAHLDDSERMGAESFRELVESQKRLVEAEITTLSESLNPINKTIIELELKQSPAYTSELGQRLKKKEEELNAIVEPIPVSDPNDDPKKKADSAVIVAKISELREKLTTLETLRSDLQKEKTQILVDLKTIKDAKKELEIQVQKVNDLAAVKSAELKAYGIDVNAAVMVQTDFTAFNAALKTRDDRLVEIRAILGESQDATRGITSAEKPEPSLDEQIEVATVELKTEQDKLGSEQRKFQDYLQAKSDWEIAKSRVIGDSLTKDTIEYYKSELRYVTEELESELTTAIADRERVVRAIFKKKKEVIDIYKMTKVRIDKIIESKLELLKDYTIAIEASLDRNHNFQQKLFAFVNHGKVGTFYSKDGAENQLKVLMQSVDFDNEDSVIDFLNTLLDAFKHDKRDKMGNVERYVGDQVESIAEMYKYVYSLSYLDYNYQLRQGGKLLDQLSPGERGALLLVFYLLLDKSDIPLIIDQPEDNLDNHSVASILVPFIRAAKAKRQIVMVTHNPNLAVVSDSEQVIYVEIDKEHGNLFRYASGSIENLIINEKIVHVLEGAMPAFNKRKDKYNSDEKI